MAVHVGRLYQHYRAQLARSIRENLREVEVKENHSRGRCYFCTKGSDSLIKVAHRTSEGIPCNFTFIDELCYKRIFSGEFEPSPTRA